MPSSRPIRRSQLISPFGVGAMVDFPRDESLMPAGLDAWPKAKQECPRDSGWLVREERLEARLGVTHFRLPPDYRDSVGPAAFSRETVPFVRFPRWQYCHHCGGMSKVPSFSSTRERCKGRSYPQQSCEKRASNRRPFLIPVRFVAACGVGHVQDFPFMEWVHRDKPSSNTCELRMRAGRSSAGLSGISVECSCGQKQSMGDVFRFDEVNGGPLSSLGQLCSGLRPWLGETDSGAAPCGQHLRVLQRGASNVYFPQVVSSIYLPLWAESVSADVVAVLEEPRYWLELSRRTVGGKVDEDACNFLAGLFTLDANALRIAAQRKLDGKPVVESGPGASDEEAFRRSEYQAIAGGKVGPQSELHAACVTVDNYADDVIQYFSRIALVHKLRETRALAGFSRILPPDGSATSSRLQPLKLDPKIDWLPAIKVYGEGLFLEVDNVWLASWLGTPSVGQRLAPLARAYNTGRTERQQPHRNVGAKFVLLHTLAHLLINQLSFDCGYGSASLRERLYCDFSDSTNPMQGILIYTASGDSEGTMGGLVRQGKPGRLEATIRSALRNAMWCSSDPVCIESGGQGSDNANLAACHGCSLLPETSCEEGNRLLDRGLLVGTPENPELGFFHSLLR